MGTSLIRPWVRWYGERASSILLPESSIYTPFKNAVNRFSDHTAIIFEGESIDYKTLKKKVDKLAGAWKEIGLKKGDRIGLMMHNHPLYIVSYYAAQALGVIVVQLNPMHTFREMMKIVVHSQVQFIVFDKSSWPTIEAIKEVYSFKQCFSIEEDLVEYTSLQYLIENGKEISKPEDINPHEDVAVIQYTGGTIGEIKGVMLTHYNLTSNVVQSAEMYREKMTPGEEIILSATQLCHIYAMTSTMNLGIYLGATILLFPKFQVQPILDAIEKYRPTYFPGVAEMYNAFINYSGIEKYNLKCLNHCSSGSSPLPIEVILRFEELTGTKIAEGFGLSEASPITHRNPPFAKRKIGSFGIPLPGTDCMIIDENDMELGPNCVGELLIKGPQIMKGYWNDEEKTRITLQNGWLYTGDLAMMDEEGYFYFVGRKKDMIIIGGFNIFPREIESVLYEHPDIQEVAVVSIPQSGLDDLLKAFLVSKKGVTIDINEIKGYCYSKLTPYKIPKEFEVIDELPRNNGGKLLKRQLIKSELEKNRN
ncbi:long-chain-fatty-acid--CoA ligase [Psychrobacillus soli]|uniref:Long-chain fatty acid--CoA ligase n=1 Tax=Psychrobacillus soli TaxID=1543965 RepID=A0A544TLI3_9BACI|nr:long-chain fatty acid--CoA ligase [Psychrobacillus soli]TQR18323.1 long-chain fatty acid--CoA ligase [Psychrobacillus soli]